MTPSGPRRVIRFALLLLSLLCVTVSYAAPHKHATKGKAVDPMGRLLSELKGNGQDPTNKKCGAGCPTGTTCCKRGCVDLLSDRKNCGACDTKCRENSVCSVGACVCPTDFGDCNNDLEDGCEVDLLTTDANCGACGNVCGPNSACWAGKCVCAANFADCNGDQTDGCEVDLRANCGSCNACGANSVCSAGSCVCTTSFGDCNNDPADGCETDLTKAANCGACSNACGADLVCSEGTCKEPPGCFTNSDCGGSLCVFKTGVCAGPGTCTVKPTLCPAEFNPVCGCDGRTYPNECRALATAISVRGPGECPGARTP